MKYYAYYVSKEEVIEYCEDSYIEAVNKAMTHGIFAHMSNEFAVVWWIKDPYQDGTKTQFKDIPKGYWKVIHFVTAQDRMFI